MTLRPYWGMGHRAGGQAWPIWLQSRHGSRDEEGATYHGGRIGTAHRTTGPNYWGGTAHGGVWVATFPGMAHVR